jgi:hypothetical protein
MTINTCEWCKNSYPDFDETETYWRVNVFNKSHTICYSCYQHLRKVE